MVDGRVWGEFERDPRAREHGHLRASDRDRDVLQRLLGEAYADGRLDGDEFAERTEVVAHARTLGELPGVVADLVPTDVPLVPVRPVIPDLQAQATAAYRSERTSALTSFVVVSAVLWLIWWLTSQGHGHPWPIYPMAFLGIAGLTPILQRNERIARHARRIERREIKRLRAVQRYGLPPGR